MRRSYQRMSVSNIWLFLLFCFFFFFILLRRGLPLACSNMCLDASVDNVQSRAHEVYGIIIWLCSWSTFLFCRICLGRRCLHNLVGFFLLCFGSPYGAFRTVRSPMAKCPVAGRTTNQKLGEENERLLLSSGANRK